MENQEDNLQQNKTINPGKFQAEPTPQQEKEYQQDQMTSRSDEAGYTPQEDQFADGKGTQLNQEIATHRGDIEDELSEEVEGTFEDQKFGEEDLDEDFEEFKQQNDQG